MSSYTTTLHKDVDAAYVTLEGMIVYSCDAYPASPATTFTHNALVDGYGHPIRPGSARHAWTAKGRHAECGQAALLATDGSGDVTLRYRTPSAVVREQTTVEQPDNSI